MGVGREAHELIEALEDWGLKIAPDKIQVNPPFSYLGRVLNTHIVSHAPLQLPRDRLLTLNDFQKLLGDIHWICPHKGRPIGFGRALNLVPPRGCQKAGLEQGAGLPPGNKPASSGLRTMKLGGLVSNTLQIIKWLQVG